MKDIKKLVEFISTIPEDTRYTNPRVTFDGVHWYIAVGIDVKQVSEKLTDEIIGIDVGIKDLAICSNRRGLIGT